jgi:hypothetical protein
LIRSAAPHCLICPDAEEAHEKARDGKLACHPWPRLLYQISLMVPSVSTSIVIIIFQQ